MRIHGLPLRNPSGAGALLVLGALLASCVTARAFDELPDSLPLQRAPRPVPLDSLLAPLVEPAAPELDPGLQRDLQVADSLVAAQGGPSAGDSRLLLSWNAPYGEPRARATHRMSCRADGSTDTLFLAFECGRESATFNGFLADLVVKSADGDTLGAWWTFGSGPASAGPLRVEFGPDPSMPGETPWKAAGQGIAQWSRTSLGGLLRVAYAISYKDATPVHRHQRYTLARIILPHVRALPGCERPVCIEWDSASLAFALRDESTVREGERFVSLQSDRPAACGGAPAAPRGRTRR